MAREFPKDETEADAADAEIAEALEAPCIDDEEDAGVAVERRPCGWTWQSQSAKRRSKPGRRTSSTGTKWCSRAGSKATFMAKAVHRRVVCGRWEVAAAIVVESLWVDALRTVDGGS